jgi:hypothetical protein
VLLASGCQSIPNYSVVDNPASAKAPRPEVMDKELPPPLFFQDGLQASFDKLLPKPTK